MQTAASKSLVLTDSSSFKWFADSKGPISYAEFYQLIASELIRSVYHEQVLGGLGDRLVMLVERAHTFRQTDALKNISQLLVRLPLPRQYEAVGRYYSALSIQRFGRGNLEGAVRPLEDVAESGPLPYRIRALRSLGANSIHRGEYRTALSLYYDADLLASRSGLLDPLATVRTQKDVAVIKSLEGNHRDSVGLLEQLFPLAHAMRGAQPHVYYDYLNGLAMELCEVGRLEEARNASQIVLASPFAPAYPEWHETREEIELRGQRASRSTVGFSHSVTRTVEGIGSDESSEAERPSSVLVEFAADSAGVSQGTAEASNILRFPVREQGVGSGFAAFSSDKREPARVLIMSERNQTLGREFSETLQAKKSYGDLDGRQMLLKIMELTAAKDITDYELLKILESIESILFRQRAPGKR